MESWDVIVVGAGPGGSATAYYLARGGAKVLLLDRSEFPRDKTCGDGLTPRAVAVLRDMNLLDDLRQVGCAIGRFEVVAPNGNRTGSSLSVANDSACGALVVPRHILDERILRRAVEVGAEFRGGTGVTEVLPDTNGVRVVRGGGQASETLRARCVVLATGATSRLLLQTGILKRAPKVMVATRAYFEGVSGLDDAWSIYFNGVPMPGYGWVFPTGPDSANIGAGYLAADKLHSSKHAFDEFLGSGPIREMLSAAKQVGPARGYPLRADFLNSPTYGVRTLVVGEAAGLVNPMTGEGIDYALESGGIAAREILAMLHADDFSRQRMKDYDRALRRRFARKFRFCLAVRALCMHRRRLNLLVGLANRRASLRDRLVKIVLGGSPALEQEPGLSSPVR